MSNNALDPWDQDEQFRESPNGIWTWDSGEPLDSHEERLVRATPYVWVDPDTIPQRPWLFGRWFSRRILAGVVAPGGIGKTTFLAGVCLSAVTGRALLGKTVWEGRNRVWVWNLEDSMDELTRSIQATAKHFDISPDDIGDRLFVDSAMEGATLCTAIEDQDGFKLVAPVYAGITAELKRRKIDVLIIDPFVSSHEIEENSNTKIDKVGKAWSRVANEADCAIVLVHHTSKQGSADVSALSARGAVALINVCRTVVVLNRMDTETAERFGFDDKERRRYFTAQDDKHNRAPAENADWFRLESVDLGNGGAPGTGDSVGVAEPWSPPDPFEGLTGQHLYKVQLAIEAGEWRENHQSPQWAGIAVAEALLLNAEDKTHRRRILQLLKTWLKEGALIVVSRPDAKRNERKFIEVGKWQNDGSAPPATSEAGQGVAVGQKACPTTTPTFSGGVGRGAAGLDTQVRQNQAAPISFDLQDPSDTYFGDAA